MKTATLWLCSEPSSDGSPKPESDDGASKIKANTPITAETAAEIAVETVELDMCAGEEWAVWVWQPGDVDNAVEYFVRVSLSWSFTARQAGVEAHHKYLKRL